MHLHKHHIKPVHVGGTNDPSNLVLLTVEEHAEAHRKLWEEHGRWQDYLAWQGLSGRIGKEELIRAKLSFTHKGKKLSKEQIDNLRTINMHREYYFSEDHKKKLSANHADIRGNKNPFFGKKHSEETKKKLAEAARKRNVGRDKNGRFKA